MRLIYLSILSIILFMPLTAYGATWYDSNYLLTRSIEVDNSDIDSNLTDYPLYLNITSIDVGVDTQADCDDIVITDYYNVTKLSHEIETCDSSDDQIEIWVKVPTVFAANTTRLNLFYDYSSATDQQDSQNVWRSEFVLVDHNNGTNNDSTSNGNDGSPTGLSSVDTPRGLGYSKTNTVDIVDYGDIDEVEGIDELTAQGWMLIDDLGGDDTLISKYGSGLEVFWLFHDVSLGGSCSGSEKFTFYTIASGAYRVCSTGSLNTGEWYHVTAIFDNGNPLLLYVNGTTDKTTGDTPGASLNSGTTPVTTFDVDYGWGDLQGDIDEVRLYTGILSDAWIDADYSCQVAGSDGCVTIGDEETEPTGSQSISLSESTTITDTLVFLGSGVMSLSESMGINDALVFLGSGGMSLSESTTITDTLVFLGMNNIQLSESAAITDDLVFTGSGVMQLTESGIVSDTLVFFYNDLNPNHDETGDITDELVFICSGTCVEEVNNAIVIYVKKDPFYFGFYNDTSRFTCSSTYEGGVIYNTQDLNLNICDGNNWIFPNGTTT